MQQLGPDNIPHWKKQQWQHPNNQQWQYEDIAVYIVILCSTLISFLKVICNSFQGYVATEVFKPERERRSWITNHYSSIKDNLS